MFIPVKELLSNFSIENYENSISTPYSHEKCAESMQKNVKFYRIVYATQQHQCLESYTVCTTYTLCAYTVYPYFKRTS